MISRYEGYQADLDWDNFWDTEDDPEDGGNDFIVVKIKKEKE